MAANLLVASPSRGAICDVLPFGLPPPCMTNFLFGPSNNILLLWFCFYYIIFSALPTLRKDFEVVLLEVNNLLLLHPAQLFGQRRPFKIQIICHLLPVRRNVKSPAVIFPVKNSPSQVAQ